MPELDLVGLRFSQPRLIINLATTATCIVDSRPESGLAPRKNIVPRKANGDRWLRVPPRLASS